MVHRQVITPDTVKVVRGKGMPISKSPGQHGDLRIKFMVQQLCSLHVLWTNVVLPAGSSNDETMSFSISHSRPLYGYHA
jgi:DnaJ-class molecular chaperone